MFGTILGALPRPPLPPDASPDELVAAAIRAQEAVGLEPLTDGRLRWASLDAPFTDGAPPRPVDAWRAASTLTGRAVKASLPGPYSLARRLLPDARGRHDLTRQLVSGLRAEIVALVAAGCTIVEIEEDAAAAIGADAGERRAFRDAHAALTDGLGGVHLSLALLGPSAASADIATILAGSYSSLAVDLIAGPDNWRLVAATPGERGIVAGAISVLEDGDEGPEVPLYAARYAASTGSRGIARVGLATAAGLDRLPWVIAVRKLSALGRAVRVAGLSPGPELAEAVDPRSIDIRSAALGRPEPRETRAAPRRRRAR